MKGYERIPSGVTGYLKGLIVKQKFLLVVDKVLDIFAGYWFFFFGAAKFFKRSVYALIYTAFFYILFIKHYIFHREEKKRTVEEIFNTFEESV